jgi:hypothetical protein
MTRVFDDGVHLRPAVRQSQSHYNLFAVPRASRAAFTASKTSTATLVGPIAETGRAMHHCIWELQAQTLNKPKLSLDSAIYPADKTNEAMLLIVSQLGVKSPWNSGFTAGGQVNRQGANGGTVE